MNLRDLHYFVVLADVKHFGEAAKRCFVSQPTLSMQIKKLEDSLGVVLFERTNKQVFLTDHGHAFLSRAKTILLLVEEMKYLAKQSQDPFAGELRLGVIPTVAPALLPLVLPMMKKEFPHLKVWLIEDQTHRLVDKLAGGDIDAAIMAQPIDHHFMSINLYEEPFYFACTASHRLARKKKIAISDLADEQLMLLAEGHCLRDQAMAVCQMAKANEMADFTATSLGTLRLMAQEGVGVTLLPALTVLSEPSDVLDYIPFSSPVPSRQIALFGRVGSPKQICLEGIAGLISRLIEPKLKLFDEY
jgi:LysR family transcriptional regulator, hydrogen peroxide-inducible genes activator